MKLITKIIVICSLAVLGASVTVSAIIWGMIFQSRLEEAYAQAQQDTLLVFTRLEKGINEARYSSADKVHLEYLLKKENDPYNLCFQEGMRGETVEIYNRTVFQREFFTSLEYTALENLGVLSWAELDWEGRHYLIFAGTLSQDTEFYHLADITYVEEEMIRMAALLLLLTGAVLLCTMLFLYLVLKRVLRPLKDLSEGACQIAEGQYDQRITVTGRDEIGQLSENFNKMAAAVEYRTHRLEESEHKKTLFMGNLTHELKTPMTSISGYAQTLLHVKVSEEDRVEALKYIYQECGRLERLSQKMMRLLELDQETELPLAELPVKEVFSQAARSCQELLKRKGMTLVCQEHGESFWMDPDLMTDAVINLIDNAAKASEGGRQIILRAGADYIEVEDFGKGIPKEEQDKILEPFYMVDKSRSRKHGGAGLGLALTALIARIHHCRVEIESEEGKGTVIRLQFV